MSASASTDQDLDVERLAVDGCRTDADLDRAPVRIDTSAPDMPEDAVGEGVGVLGRAEPQDDELITTPSADEVRRPD